MCSSRSMRALVTGLACFLCIGILLSLFIFNGGTNAAAPVSVATVASSGERHIGDGSLDPFYASKRRVPNGPDPIHNRRAGKFGRPPARA